MRRLSQWFKEWWDSRHRRREDPFYLRRIYDWEEQVLALDPRLGVKLSREQAEEEANHLMAALGHHKYVSVVIDPTLNRRVTTELMRKRIVFRSESEIYLFDVLHENAHVMAYHYDGEPVHGDKWWYWYGRQLEKEVGPEAIYFMNVREDFGLTTPRE